MLTGAGDRADVLVMRGFRRDQARDKGFGGVALGTAAPAAITEAFEAHGYTVHRAPSDWVVDRRSALFAQESVVVNVWLKDGGLGAKTRIGLIDATAPGTSREFS